MIRRQNKLGEIAVSNNVYTYLPEAPQRTASASRAWPSAAQKDGLVHLLRRESLAKGVLVRTRKTAPFRSICISSSIRA